MSKSIRVLEDLGEQVPATVLAGLIGKAGINECAPDRFRVIL
jgi:hypothetical protein